MTLSPVETLVMVFAGIAIGMGFFGGLRWTIQRLPETRHPFALALGSLVIRTGLVMGALILLGRSEWQRYLALLVGIFIARLIAVRLWGTQRISRAASVDTEGE